MGKKNVCLMYKSSFKLDMQSWLNFLIIMMGIDSNRYSIDELASKVDTKVYYFHLKILMGFLWHGENYL